MTSDISAPATVPIADQSLAAFYRDMTATERRTFWACAAGWALDGMDFMIYPLVIGTIITLWQVDKGAAGLAVTLTLLFSAVGGWFAGYVPIASAGYERCRLPFCGSLASACCAPRPNLRAIESSFAPYLGSASAANGRRARC